MSRISVFRSRFFWKIYLTFSLLFLSTTLLVSWIVSFKVQETIRANVVDNLRDKANFLVPQSIQLLLGHENEAQDVMQSLAKGTGSRITLIRADGVVVADSEVPLYKLDNHWNRPEVQAALEGPFGLSERPSVSIKSPMLYVAQAVRNKGQVIGVVRVSLPLAKVLGELDALRVTIAVIVLGGIIAALVIGWSLTRRISIPIGEMVQVAEAMRSGQYEQKVRTLGADELGRLGDTLNRLGSELTSKISELQRLENVRRDFVANVSHEIKTPLTSIKGYVETLLNGAINEPEHRTRFLEKIERNAERLTSLVQDLLSLAKIEATEDEFKPTPVEWSPILSSVLARYEDLIQHKGLKVKVVAPPQPLVVMGDKESMTQVLDNLLTNAIKYTPDGGRITLTLMLKSNWCKLIVEDTGIGIPHEHLDRIFERFYRVDKARSRELGGTGLGLSIVKHLVAAMQGEIGVESSVGIGSRFTVKLHMAT
jgi:signal transduction histidine kinase